jgi:D-glucosaminate-specific PTS system IIB component
MNNIVLTRVDSRLIHGQVMTKWVKQVEASVIVVVSDTLADDDYMRDIYMLSAPVGVNIIVYSIAGAIEAYNKNGFGEEKVLLLVPDLQTMDALIEAGIELTALQIGGLGGGPQRKVVFQNITLDDADVMILTNLANRGIVTTFQTIPEERPQTWETMFKKYNKGL